MLTLSRQRNISHVAKSIFFSENFGFITGERIRFCPVPGARNCVNLHLIIHIIHDCCNNTTPFIYLNQVNTKYSN